MKNHENLQKLIIHLHGKYVYSNIYISRLKKIEKSEINSFK